MTSHLSCYIWQGRQSIGLSQCIDIETSSHEERTPALYESDAIVIIYLISLRKDLCAHMYERQQHRLFCRVYGVCAISSVLPPDPPRVLYLTDQPGGLGLGSWQWYIVWPVTGGEANWVGASCPLVIVAIDDGDWSAMRNRATFDNQWWKPIVSPESVAREKGIMVHSFKKGASALKRSNSYIDGAEL